MAKTGIGAQFRRWNVSTGEWDDISDILTISGPSMSRETKDTTVLGTTGGYRTFIGALRSGGTIVFGMLFDRDTYEQMLTDFEDDDPQNYEIVLPDDDNTSLEFEGLVTELPLTISEEPMQCDVTIKITGSVNLESGSGPSADA